MAEPKKKKGRASGKAGKTAGERAVATAQSWLPALPEAALGGKKLAARRCKIDKLMDVSEEYLPGPD